MKISKLPERTKLQACDIENVIPSAIGNVGLVKLLHSPPVTKLTIEHLIGNIFNHKNELIKNKHTQTIN